MDRTTQVNVTSLVVRLLAVTTILGCAVFGTSPSPALAEDLPYTDPNASGFIGLCDANDTSIDHGRVADQPFVRSAVSSEAAPAPYDADGRTATLFAFQPREGTEPTEWSGQLLTAATRFDDPAHPTAIATDVDDSLATFLDIYPPQWDGLIQLRLYLAAPGQPALTQGYAATDIQVDGDSWKVVRGGATPCNSSTAQSTEDLLPRDPGLTTPAAPAVAATDGRRDSGQKAGTNAGLGILVILVAGAGLVAMRRRRQRAAPPTSPDETTTADGPVRTR
jgi:hypothetical protein